MCRQFKHKDDTKKLLPSTLPLPLIYLTSTVFVLNYSIPTFYFRFFFFSLTAPSVIGKSYAAVKYRITNDH